MQRQSDLTLWYSVASYALAILLALRWLGFYISQLVAAWSTYVILKYLRYTEIRLLRKLWLHASAGDLALYATILSGNVICITWRVQSISEVSSRTALILLTNLALLLPSADLVADSFRISLRAYRKVHVAIASLVLVQSILHPCLAISDLGLIWNLKSITGVIALSSVLLVALTSIGAFQRRAYEVFRFFHVTASAGITIVLWFHISREVRLAWLNLLLASSIWGLSLIFRYSLLFYRNLAWGKRTRVKVEASERALKLEVTPARPWKVRPGQYVYLTLSRTGTLSRFQRHPFMVASPIYSNSIELHIWPRQGFTRKLLGSATYCDAWIEGPYGHRLDFREFGTVIMIASGIGITGHLSYLRDLVEKQNDFDTKTRDVVFIWCIDKGFTTHPARKFMDELLRKDKERARPSSGQSGLRALTKSQRYSLDTSETEYPGFRPTLSGNNVLDIYIYRGDLKENQHRGAVRLVEIPGQPDYPAIIRDILATRSGSIAISVCADTSNTNKIRATVSEAMNKNVRLIVSDFEPFPTETSGPSASDMSIMCRGID